MLYNGPIQTSLSIQAAPTTRAHCLIVEWLPKYAPELNDIKTVWRDLKAHYIARQTLKDKQFLDHAVETLNQKRKRNLLVNQKLSA